jgi:hypothetical protein
VTTPTRPRSGAMTAASSPMPSVIQGGGAPARARMRSMSARSPTSSIVREEVRKPRFAVWGGRMNLLMQVEPL